MPPAVRQIGGYFLWALGLIVAAATLYEVGQVAHQPILLPAGIGLALALALIRYSLRWGPRIMAWRRERARRIAEYPKIEAKATQLNADIAEFQTRLEAMRIRGDRRYQAGVREGHAQVNGARLAARVKEMPTIEGVTMTGERVQLRCRRAGVEPIAINTRFFLLVTWTGQPLGVVSITSLSDDGVTLTAEPVEEIDEPFWRALKQRADHDFAPPHGVGLAPYRVATLVDAQQLAEPVHEILREEDTQ